MLTETITHDRQSAFPPTNMVSDVAPDYIGAHPKEQPRGILTQICYTPDGLDENDVIKLHSFGNAPALMGMVRVDALKSEELKDDYGTHLLRMRYGYDSLGKLKRGKRGFGNMFFKMSDGVFVEISGRHGSINISATAQTQERVDHWLTLIATKYGKRVIERTKPTFAIVCMEDGRPGTEDVDISRTFALGNESMQLLYGDDFLPWEQSLVTTMKTKETGVLLFQGPPGTGKTSFIRHLIDKLKRTHRFYYMPVTNQELLTSPNMVSFWARENREHENKKKVIILEDAEMLLERGNYGRSGAVANLLNIADGLLGELLKVQLLCTINCDASMLDEAVIRPGRLLDYREFPRLKPDQAKRIADKNGLSLPALPDYALSDIFGKRLATAPAPTQHKRVLGFGASQS